MSKFLMTALVAATTGALGFAPSTGAVEAAKPACCCGDSCTCENCKCTEGCDDCQCEGCGCDNCTGGSDCCEKE
jgi:hypothetical protein